MSAPHDRAADVAALRRAVPYLRLYQGRVFVIKAGGELFGDGGADRSLVEQVGVLHRLGIRVVLVHGGGRQVSDLSRDRGHEPRKVEGRRVTDAPDLEAAVMVLNGTLRTRLLALARELGVPAAGISGLDGGILNARRRPPVTAPDGARVDYGFVGDVVSTDMRLLHRLLDDGFLPVVSPLAADASGQVLNVNADVVAACLARELEAEKLVMVTSVPGILEDASSPASLVSYTDVAGLERLKERGALKGGMLPKTAAVKDALYGGVARVHIISQHISDSLLVEVFTNEGSGTLVVLDTRELLPEELHPKTRLHTLMDMGQEEAGP